MFTEMLPNHPGWQHYRTLGEHYDKERPGYPAGAIHEIACRARSLRDLSRTIVDVGCGTGLFTRMLAETLDESFEVHGLEPSSTMIEKAMETTRTARAIRFLRSAAEELPFHEGTVAAITSAGAAQLFDRKLFYREVHRTLVKGGLLAILQNKRIHEAGFFRAFERFLENFVPGYRTGTYADATGGHSAADLPTNSSLMYCFPRSAFTVGNGRERLQSRDSRTSLSTIQVQMARTEHGDDAIISELRSNLSEHCDCNGRIHVAYRTELTAANRAAVSSR